MICIYWVRQANSLFLVPVCVQTEGALVVGIAGDLVVVVVVVVAVVVVAEMWVVGKTWAVLSA